MGESELEVGRPKREKSSSEIRKQWIGKQEVRKKTVNRGTQFSEKNSL